MPYEEILYAAKGSIGYLTLNNPQKINALSKKMIGEIIRVLGEIADASRYVLAIGKQGFYAQVDQPDNNAMHYAKHTIAMSLSAEDAQNGIDAFLNKKTPIWKDR